MTTFVYHVSSGGRRVATWGGGAEALVPVLSTPSFSMEVDGSIGPLTIELQREFGEGGDDVVEGNVVRTYAVRDDGTELLIHEGVIETIDETITTDASRAVVTVQPYITQLALDHFRDDAAGTVIAKTWTSTEVATILAYILDKATQRKGPFARIRHVAGSIQQTGKTLSIQIGSETYLSALRRIKKLGPGNFYFYVDPTGAFTYRAYDSGTRHRFTLGRELDSFRRTRDLSETRNTVYFWNQSDADGTVIAFERPSTASSSQTRYGRRVEIVTDSRIDNAATAEAVTDAYLREHQDTVTTYDAEIAALDDTGKGYPIESITPGDIVEIANVPAMAGTLLSVLRVDYNAESAHLTLGHGPARRPRTLGMTIEEMSDFMRTSTDGSIPSTTTA